MTPAPKTRLPAAERRQALIDAALRVFACGSYGGATTAQIAREAGVSEPILYRHFASKRELYLACLEASWSALRAELEQAIADPGPAGAVEAWMQAVRDARGRGALPANLWIQALTEAGDDAEIAAYLRRHFREVHDFVAAMLRRGQDAGAVPADRDPDAEAWIFIAGGLLLSVADRLGGLVTQDDLAAVAAARLRWLTGT